MSKLVSVIIPVYNTEAYIEKCLKSVIGQTYQNFEVIIINDGSTDSSGEICEKYAVKDRRVKLLHQKNQGIVSARNEALKLARGEYVCFIDSDDWIESNTIEMMIAGIGQADLISVGVFYEKNETKNILMLDRYDEGVYSEAKFEKLKETMLYNAEDKTFHSLSSWIWNKLYRTKLAKELHNTVSRDLCFAEDTVFLLKYILECKTIVISHRCLYHYVCRPNSFMNSIHKNMLSKINDVYIELLEWFDRKKENGMINQLQFWVADRARVAINEQMGFINDFYIPEYQFKSLELNSGRIVIYGAGEVGKDLYKQLIKRGKNIVAWVDEKYYEYMDEGLNVESVDNVLKINYDVIYIAVKSREVYESIAYELVQKGILEDKIIWMIPQRICI